MEETDCAICYENVKISEICKTNCDHFFCENCLNQWFDRGSASCPVCRETVKTYEKNNETIRLVHKTVVLRAPRTNNRRIIRMNRRLTLTISTLVFATGVGSIYMGFLVWEQYKDLQEYQDSLRSCENRYNDLTNVQILWETFTKTCKIPQIFIRECLN